LDSARVNSGGRGKAGSHEKHDGTALNRLVVLDHEASNERPRTQTCSFGLLWRCGKAVASKATQLTRKSEGGRRFAMRRYFRRQVQYVLVTSLSIKDLSGQEEQNPRPWPLAHQEARAPPLTLPKSYSPASIETCFAVTFKSTRSQLGAGLRETERPDGSPRGCQGPQRISAFSSDVVVRRVDTDRAMGAEGVRQRGSIG